MAEKDRGVNPELDKVIPDGGTLKTDKNTGAKATGKRPGTGTGTGTGTDTAGTGATKEKELSGLAVISPDTKPDAIPAPAEPKKAKRQRTSTKKTQKNNDPVFNAEQITGLLMGMSAVMTQSETGKFFALTESECKSIAEPLANIISKNDAFAQLGEHSDAIALTSACFMIFLPKIIAFIMYQKQIKALKKQNPVIIKEDKKDNGTQRTHSGSNGQVARPDAGSIQTDDTGLLSILPPFDF